MCLSFYRLWGPVVSFSQRHTCVTFIAVVKVTRPESLTIEMKNSSERRNSSDIAEVENVGLIMT